MDGSILINKITTPQVGYIFSLRGPIFGDDIEDLCSEIINTIINRSGEIETITIDIRNAHEYLFKPKRILGTYKIVKEHIAKNNSNISVCLKVNPKQKKILMSVSTHIQNNQDIEVSEYIKKRKADKFELNNFDELLKAIFEDKYKSQKLIKKFCMTTISISSIGIIFSLIFLQSSIIGFATFMSFSILMYESWLIYAKYFKGNYPHSIQVIDPKRIFGKRYEQWMKN